MTADENKVRLDKWLWAARFYKTRTLARAMVDGGKVEYNGYHAKAAREVEIGAKIRLLQGETRLEVEVRALSAVRGPAAVARTLYAETDASLRERKRAADLRRFGGNPRPDARPNKKEHRQLRQLKFGTP